MARVELSAGGMEYEDTGGEGPVVVLLHGLLMDGTLWRKVVGELGPRFRCILPTLPLGGHREPMRPDADLSMRGIALLVGEFLEKLNLRDVTLAFNDWGGTLLLISDGRAERVGRLLVTSCEAFDNVPPGLPGRMIVRAAATRATLWLALQQLRLRSLRRLRLTWGDMSKRAVPNEVMDAWFHSALTKAEIRRDLRKYLSGAKQAKADLERADVSGFDRPVIIAWAAEDRVMPPEHGRRLAKIFPRAKLVEVPDSFTLIPEDQPGVLAREIRALIQTR